MIQTDLQKLLAQALDGDGKAHSKLTSLIVHNDYSIWQSVVNACAFSTLEAVELSKLPVAVCELNHTELAPYVRVVRSETVQKRIRHRFKQFLSSL